MNDWLQLGGLLDRLGLQAPTPAGLLDAPVGTSTTQRVSNASPEFSPMISSGLLSNEQRLGAFWNLATRRAKPYTNADLPALAASGQEAVDAALGWSGMMTPLKGMSGQEFRAYMDRKFPNVDFYAIVTPGRPEVIVSKVIVPEELRGNGVGTQVMQEVARFADDNGRIATLSPTNEFGGNLRRLREFYSRLGFVPNKGQTRNPATGEAMWRPLPRDAK